MIKIFLLAAALMFSSLNLFAATYYVDASLGNDNNNGTATTSAWKTISKVNGRTFSPGDNILLKRGNTWYERLVVSSSGTSTAPIVYGSYGSGVLPIIDGRGTLVQCGYSSGRNYITFREMKFQNAQESGATLRLQSGTGLRVENCEFLITAHGGVYLQSTTNAVVIGNKMTTPAAALTAQTDGVYMQRTTGTVIDGNNIVISNTHPDPHCDGIQSYQDNSFTIRNNYVEQRNTKTNNSQGIYATESAGSSVYYNNVVICPYTKSSIMGFLNITTSGRIAVYNNTAIGYGTNSVYIKNDPYAIVKNNILVSKGNYSPARFTVPMNNWSNLDNNLYNRPGGTGLAVVYIDAIGVKTLSQIKSMGAESKGKESDPKLNTDFTLTSISPAIDGGITLGGALSTDKAGTVRPQGLSYDIGAYEYKTVVVAPTYSKLKSYASSGVLSGGAAFKTFTGSKSTKVLYMRDNTGSAKFTFNIPVSGTWYMWGRFNYDFVTASGLNSFSARLDNSTTLLTFGNSETYRKWHWDGSSGAKLSLGTVSTGTHTVTIGYREKSQNIMLDVILLTNDPNYVPTDVDFTLAKDGDNGGSGTDSTETAELTPEKFEVAQNYPNPFNPSTVIKYSLPVNAEVSVKVYDMLGAEVATLFNGMQTAGVHTVNFDGAKLASGTYIYAIRTKDFFETRKMMLLK